MNPERRKIIIITSRADFGGGPEHIYSLIKELYRDFIFYIACPDDIPYKIRFSEVIGEDKIIIIPHRKFKVKSFIKLIRFVKNNDIDIIHSHGKGAGIYSRPLSFYTLRPCIHTFHGVHILSYNFFQRKMYLFLEKLLSLFTKRFISVSDSEKDNVIKLGLTSKSKLTLIKNGVEPSKQKVKFNFNEINFSTITRFDDSKNTELLIPIAVSLKNKLNKHFSFHIVGSGERENLVKDLVYKNNLSNNFIFYGNLLKPSDILIKTNCYISTSKWEGLPLGVLEAMSLGLPVLATDVVGNKDVVENNKTGFLFNINNPEEVVGFSLQLFNNESLWNEFSVSAKEKVEKEFSIKQMAEETKKLYNEILKQN
ncbi:MAG TPA: glycosyltransferase [Ignavibacteriaceae bacterium]|nr:glycosyltransferase [Ignavibacteriaceae bacterium]